MRVLEPTAEIWMKVDPHYQQQKCRPMTLVSGNIWCTHIFAGVPLGGGPHMRVGLSPTAIFGDLSGYFFGNFRDKASNVIWRYATPCWPMIDWLQNGWPRMTLSRYFMSKSVFGQHFLTQRVWLSKIIAWKVANIDVCSQQQKCRSMTLVFGKYKLFLDIRKRLQITIVKPEWGGWNRRICIFFVSFVKKSRRCCTLWQQPVLDFCWHQ